MKTKLALTTALALATTLIAHAENTSPATPPAQQPKATTKPLARDLQNLKKLTAEQLKRVQDIVIQLASRPGQDSAAGLSLKEHLTVAQILVDLSFRGLGLNVTSAVGLQLSQKDLAEQALEPFEKNIFTFFTSLHDQSKLRPFLQSRIGFVNQALTIVQPGSALSPETQATILEFAAANIESAVRVKGLSRDSKQTRYREWVDVNADWMKKVTNRQKVSVATYGIAQAEDVQLLVDGPASFKLREALFDRAQKSIDIMSWAIYDDITGQWLLGQLQKLRAQKPGLQVRIIVDGLTSARPGYHGIVDQIAALGVPVIKWKNPRAPFAGMHRKIMLVDGRELITGGMNFGDEYSHMNPNGQKWRDTDVYVKGDFSEQVAQKFFDEAWDEAVQALKLDKLAPSPKRSSTAAVASNGAKQKQIALLIQNPVQFPNGSPIFAAMMNELQTAKTSVDIENAYIVAIPAMVEAVKQATARGVRVRVFTNSDQSVDEKVIGNAMRISALKLLGAGAEVYLRKGSTLHSKFMIVDNKRAYIMSYNIHPRSEKMENEMALLVNDEAVARDLADVFASDVTNNETAIRVTDPAQLAVPADVQLWVLLRLMYDQL